MDLIERAVVAGREAHEEYRRRATYEDCRFMMDFVPGILRLLLAEAAAAFPRKDRGRFIEVATREFNERERAFFAGNGTHLGNGSTANGDPPDGVSGD
jgi:hypothetical protein